MGPLLPMKLDVRFRSCKEPLSAKNMQCNAIESRQSDLFSFSCSRAQESPNTGNKNHQFRPNIASSQDAANSERNKTEMDAKAKAKQTTRRPRQGRRSSSSGMRIGSELRAIYGRG
jgi:hypothetical protein